MARSKSKPAYDATVLADTLYSRVNFDELTTYLGYLIRRAHSHIQTEFQPTLNNVGIATGAFGILTLIRANPGITAMDLVAASSLDKSTLSPMIMNLAKLGLIRREARTNDRRFQSLYFVNAAESDFQAFRRRIRDFERIVSASLSKSEQVELARLLMKMQGLTAKPRRRRSTRSRKSGE